MKKKISRNSNKFSSLSLWLNGFRCYCGCCFQMLILLWQLLGNATTTTANAVAAASLTYPPFFFFFWVCVYLSRLMNICLWMEEGTNKLPLAFYGPRNNQMIKGIVRSINTGNQIVYKQARDQKADPSMKYSSHACMNCSFFFTHSLTHSVIHLFIHSYNI